MAFKRIDLFVLNFDLVDVYGIYQIKNWYLLEFVLWLKFSMGDEESKDDLICYMNTLVKINYYFYFTH